MIKRRLIYLICSIGLIAAFSLPVFVFADGNNGTTLKEASVTATPNWEKVFDWSIKKTVTPNEWNLFKGDSATSKYTVKVDKDNGTDNKSISGVVSVLNGGAVATEKLDIKVNLTNSSGKTLYSSTEVNLNANPVLDPNETGNYNYVISWPANVDPGENYKVTADITISNHSGNLDSPFGPGPSSVGFQFPTTPNKVTNDQINVDDTNGSSWQFTDSGSVTYDRTFTVTDEGINANTATITETGKFSTANVTVNTFALDVSSAATTSLTRTYNWKIDKTADQKDLILAQNQEYPVNYQVTVDAKSTDSNWLSAGTISIYNPAPTSAVISSVSEIVSPDISATITGADFPYTLDAGATLTLDYTVKLPDNGDRTINATAVLQNHTFNIDNISDAGTTAFSGTNNLSFSNADVNLVYKTVSITDNLYGGLGTVSYNDTLPKIFNYTKNVGPFTSTGDYSIVNTATFKTDDTSTTGSSSWSVNVHIPSQGSTLTIGYWKTHAGSGPQRDMVTTYLPLCLGKPNEGKSVNIATSSDAVGYLNMNGDAANGINKLYAQLLASKLNIANGANGTVIKDVIAQADEFLTHHVNSDWKDLSKSDKNTVLAWATTLNNYNNGLMGVPHASE